MGEEHVINVNINHHRGFSIPLEVFEMMYAAYYYALFYDSVGEDGMHIEGFREGQAAAWNKIADLLQRALEIYNKEIREY